MDLPDRLLEFDLRSFAEGRRSDQVSLGRSQLRVGRDGPDHDGAVDLDDLVVIRAGSGGCRRRCRRRAECRFGIRARIELAREGHAQHQVVDRPSPPFRLFQHLLGRRVEPVGGGEGDEGGDPLGLALLATLLLAAVGRARQRLLLASARARAVSERRRPAPARTGAAAGSARSSSRSLLVARPPSRPSTLTLALGRLEAALADPLSQRRALATLSRPGGPRRGEGDGRRDDDASSRGEEDVLVIRGEDGR
jgi:hypothetical protein